MKEWLSSKDTGECVLWTSELDISDITDEEMQRHVSDHNIGFVYFHNSEDMGIFFRIDRDVLLIGVERELFESLVLTAYKASMDGKAVQ